MHFHPTRLAQLVTQLGGIRSRHILFTSTPLFRIRAYLFWNELEQVEFVPDFDHRQDIEGIVNLYAAHECSRPLPRERVEAIVNLSAGNYSLLTHILDVCVKRNPRLNPKQCLEDWVEHKLEHLECGTEGSDPSCPEIVVGLSAFGRGQVTVSERFLLHNLRFRKEALNSLLERGEIAFSKHVGGEVFWHLSDSGLAAAYWTFGGRYKVRRNLPELEALVYDYSVSGAPNALEAVMGLDLAQVT